MFLTEHQKRVLEAQKERARSQQIPHDRLGISKSNIDSTNTKIFTNFVEALEVMADEDNWDTFAGRFKKHQPRVWEAMRAIRYSMTKRL